MAINKDEIYIYLLEDESSEEINGKKYKNTSNILLLDSLDGKIVSYERPSYDQRVYLFFNDEDELIGANWHYGIDVDDNYLNIDKNIPLEGGSPKSIINNLNKEINRIADTYHEKENEEEENLDNQFNNAELFVENFKDYLIGKKVLVGRNNQVEEQIDNIEVAEIKGEKVISITDTDSTWFLKINDLENFIDGNEVKDFYGKDKIQLILQEEKEEEENNSLNHPEFKYYIISQDNKILGGYEYNEDAKQAAEEKQMYGNKVLVISKKDLKDINPELADNWLINEHDWIIIEKCINAGSEAGEYSPKEAAKYIEGFKKDGSYISVIKARLIYCLANAQQKLRGAYIVSNLESINEKCDENCRIQKELKRIIAMEK